MAADPSRSSDRVDPTLLGERLAGRRILVTGVTGFIGQAVLARLLEDAPSAHVDVLIRPRGSRSGHDRLRALVRKPVFTGLRDALGEDGLDQLLDERVQAVEGSLGASAPQLPGNLDVVIHCAATVSFDPPIDEAFTINLQGARSLYGAVRDSGSDAHVVHVSTAYVAGVRKGVVPEVALTHDVDWRAELDAALAARTEVERASRRPEALGRFMEDAADEQRRAGPQAVAAEAERRRRAAVEARLVEHGRVRASSLGWPDVYTFTKALGERATEEIAREAGLPLSIVRPAIVESALRWPYPGWIEGFKMADPIILAYGRGSLPEFTGVADGVVELIPVDLVANALVAVAAAPPPVAEPAYYHVSSGARNPLYFKDLYEHVRAYFQREPLPDPDSGEPIAVPEWEFPGQAKVEQRLRTGERVLGLADKVIDRLPRSDRTRDLVSKAHKTRREVEFIRRYADLFGKYTEAEVIYVDDATIALHHSLAPADQERMGFDSSVIDWGHYLEDVHCPSITTLLRLPRSPRTEPAVRVEPRPDVAAVFDLEGTIVTSNVVEAYLWLRLADLPRSAWAGEIMDVARRLPGYLSADRSDRGNFLRAFYRRYTGAAVDGVERIMAEQVGEILLRRAAPAAIRRIRRHRAAGHRTILITGAIEAVTAPLRPLFDDVMATRLEADEAGRYTGYLDEPPLVGEARAAWLRRHADAVGLDLAGSYAYGDSHSDLPLLQAVGHPVAVNPDLGLYRVAKRKRWVVERWAHDDGSSSISLPTAAGVR
jgi:alcohol-forming fatty acyl-CoA reductase